MRPMMIQIKTKRCFTLLELMIVIAIVATIGGGVFWRMSRLTEVKQVETDIGRLRGVLWSSRMLAINKKEDFELEMQESKQGWALRLISLEEPGLQFGCGKLSRLPLRFEGEENEGLQRLAVRFLIISIFRE